ncbi:hypothetical protein N7508_005132 [Penicillium antarcticum]|uniref:uncharacterized protein n=1 Tax=Penicillium antarcticum TaxID=416450 RepID=UPI0023877608|nr:uncharacterized protein N7508_005132 [Penicillium antarcticum]KAJ5306117.1 hypothetical protein N7508_005132 [Penicillium antarcticum]
MPESLEPLGQIHSLRRSLTLPTKLNPHAQRRSSVPNTPENVIFYHPSAKIVHFAPRALAPIPSSSSPSDFDYPVDTIETLPWRSATERTVATAPLRLEKVHGLTAFLKCGNVVHAILKNSQCWCVDGVSKFVLRIRPLTYYRIEIPYETEDDQSLVADLKVALPTVLRYEVTPCPFKRAFTVELPNDVMAPRRKRAWRPKDQPKHHKDSVPTIFESSQETPSPSSIRSEWIDSASTGDDTDGNLTDDSGFNSHKASSTILETIPDDHGSSPIDTLEPPRALEPSRRPVTETPQTFTSLLAKFEATSASEDELNSESEQKAEHLPSVEFIPQFGIEPEFLSAKVEPESQVAREAEAGPESASVLEANPSLAAEPEAGHESSVAEIPTHPEDLKPESVLHVESTVEPEAVMAVKPTMAVEIQTAAEDTQDVDGDASLASSPESFHSVEPASPDSVSTRPTSAGGHDPSEPSDMFDWPSAKDSVSNLEFADSSPSKKSQSLVSKSLPNDGPNDNALSAQCSLDHPIKTNSPKRFPVAFSDTEMSDTFRSRPATRAAQNPAPNTNFDHMSVEFRRRAMATRERDVSPMPPSSALYRPSHGDDATSFLSKALTLVLVPPVHLFIILIHIAARIVINPNTNTTPREPITNIRQTGNESPPVDDFSFPLEPQVSSESEIAEITRKLDPWDLD